MPGKKLGFPEPALRVKRERMTPEQRAEAVTQTQQAQKAKVAATKADDLRMIRVAAMPGIPNMIIRPDNPHFAALWTAIQQAGRKE
jgi:hypothetical protein